MTQLKNFRREQEEKNHPTPAETKAQTDKKSEPAMNASTRFNKTLTYTKAMENKSDISQKEIASPQKSQGKDER